MRLLPEGCPFAFWISTHTPHTGCDVRCDEKMMAWKYISTHTPHTGCDLRMLFTSRTTSLNFNSHTPHGVRHCSRYAFRQDDYFNSHTPHGVRQDIARRAVEMFKFQLTHPTRGATKCDIIVTNTKKRFQH